MLRTFAVLFVMIAFLPATAASEEVNAPTDSNAQSGSADYNRHPSLAPEVPTAVSGTEQPNEHAAEVDKSSLADWSMVGLSALMLVAIGIQIRIARTQSNIVKAQLAEARQKNRAYVSVRSQSVTNVGDGIKPRVVLELFNFGATPAPKIRTHIAVEVADRDLFTFPPHLHIPCGESSLMPGDKSETHWRTVVNIDAALLVDAAKDEGRALFVYGVINYEDVFGEKWSTDYRFRMMIHPKHGPVLVECEKGNGMT